MKFPDDCLYHPEHMWLRHADGVGVLGVSDFAQTQLGDVSLVSVPAPGTRITLGTVFGTIESAKVASDLFAPISGEIIEINSKLDGEPWLVNDDAYGAGWIVRVRVADPAEATELLTAADYRGRVG